MSTLAALFPYREPVVDASGALTPRWEIYFRDLQQQLGTIPSSTRRVAQTTPSTASISTTPFQTASLSAGLYEVASYVRITAAAGVSSSLMLTLSWTQGGVALSHDFAAVTGNTTTTTDSQSWTMLIDGGTPISYAFTYASNPAATMAYTYELVLKSLNA